jgi:hypothetical protein
MHLGLVRVEDESAAQIFDHLLGPTTLALEEGKVDPSGD